ncbi:MAG: ATP-dependent DNA helicase RecG [Patescibacteria group bacterium]|nr:ATP-dependent DNA helicase RecG [Patescibacteria group bacterium]
MVGLETLIKDLHRIGKVTTSRFKKLGVNKVSDLIFYYPFRYDDFSQIKKINQLQIGETATIKGQIELIHNKRSPVKHMYITEALIKDETGTLKAVWFNQPFLAKNLSIGSEVYLSGRLDEDWQGIQLINPSYEKIYTQSKQIHTAGLVPIYPTTSKLTQKQIRFLIKLTFPQIKKISDWLPESIKNQHNLIDLNLALEQIHFPSDKSSLIKARQRLKFNELFLLQLENLFNKKKLHCQPAYKIKFDQSAVQKFVAQLPFKLTPAQKKSAWEIIQDLEKNYPMNRLLEGDVGSGKTVVAVMAILNVILNQHQVALMAPTEILAQQHFKTISQLLNLYNFKIALLTHTQHQVNFKSEITRNQIIKKIKADQVDLVIGTHTLISNTLKSKIEFAKLALVIIDEQHRFGVEQRAKLIQSDLKQKVMPHFLSMTATPIPRSLALTLYDDLDLSIINQMPAGRKEVITRIVMPKDRMKAYQFLRSQIANGRQIFVICPLIDPSDKLGVKSATSEYQKLNQEIFPDIAVGLLHGKLKPADKERVVQQFLENKIKILVSTTVVEVGVDIPNASLMMIEDAERFGLAQLYQLRGRVGRADFQSYCFIFTESDNTKVRQRLKALVEAKNGFELAEKDLEFRGPGEIYGTQQSGYLNSLKIARLSDVQIIQQTKQVAQDLLKDDPNLNYHPELKSKIENLEKVIHLE